MASKSEELVAFNPTDADLLLGGLEGAGGESIAAIPRPRRGDKFGWSIAAIPEGASGYVLLRIPTETGWTNSTVQVLAFNESGAEIPADKKVLLMTIDGRWVVFDVCP